MNSKPIEGFEDYIIYENRGEYSKKRNKFIKPYISKHNRYTIDKCYYHICLYKNGKQYSKRLHRLLSLAFIPNPENLPCVDHIDRNSQNNAIENLRWASYSTNKINSGVQKDNVLGEKYINKTKDKTYVYYRFRIFQDKKMVIQKSLKTLEEVIQFKNELLKENPKYTL